MDRSALRRWRADRGRGDDGGHGRDGGADPGDGAEGRRVDLPRDGQAEDGDKARVPDGNAA
jgi:hypothetical protein